MYRHLDAPIPDVDTYLQRLETERGEDLDKDYLDTLIYAHQCKIIFENLDVYGSYKPHEPISLGIEDIFQKIIRQERGGYCFELNALFTQLLKGSGLCGVSLYVQDRPRQGSYPSDPAQGDHRQAGAGAAFL